MSQWRGRSTRRVVIRWLTITLALAPIVLACVSGSLWLEARLDGSFYWRAGLVAAIGFEIAHGLAVILATVGLAAMVLLLSKGRPRDPARRRLAARFALCCGSLVLGLSLAEAATAVWRTSLEAHHVMPPGGFTLEPGEPVALKAPTDLRALELSTDFRDTADDPTVDIVMVGESSAEGVPYNYWLSIAPILEWRLREILPGRPIQTHILAASGDTLEGQSSLVGRLERRPDLLIVYCGHNEIVARLQPSREIPYYVDDRTPSAWARFVSRLERLSPILGLLHETAEKCRIAIPPSRFGTRDLIDRPAYSEREYDLLLADFRARLDAIVAHATGLGATVVMIAPAANDAGFEPNRSYLSADTPAAERDRFRRDFLGARRLESGPPGPAIAAFRSLIARQPTFAEAHYRLARLLERQGDWETAYRHDVLARDHDGYPMRMLTPFQEVYRETAQRRGAILIDGQSYFHAIGRHGLLDEHLFHDGMHPSLRGQIALAQAILAGLRTKGALGWPADRALEPIDPAACVARFGLIPEAWRKIAHWGAMFYDLTYPMRYDPSDRLARKLGFLEAAERIRGGESPDSLGLPNLGVPEPVPLVPLVPLVEHGD